MRSLALTNKIVEYSLCRSESVEARLEKNINVRA